MANVTMPTPLLLAGGSLLLLGGYLAGVVTGPGAANRDVATVVSFDEDDERLCLTGGSVEDPPLCGEWRRVPGSTVPAEGDEFSFTTLRSDPGDEGEVTTLIYGDVVR